MKNEICTCSSCIKNIIINDDGHSTRGRFVDRSTRSRHWAKEAMENEETAISKKNPHLSLAAKPAQSELVDMEEDYEAESNPNECNDSNVISCILSFIMWLYLMCGLSKTNCRKARDMIEVLINLVLVNAGSKKKFMSDIPYDVQTIIKCLKLDFPVEHYVCCPKCYSLYDVEVAPEECGYQATVNSHLCRTELFRAHRFNPLQRVNFTTNQPLKIRMPRQQGQIQLLGEPRLRNPHTSFVSQSILSWIRWFILEPGVEESIDEWAAQVSSDSTGGLHDVTQGDVWHDLFSNNKNQLQLGFSLFIDWFNPRGNKILGKQISMGIIALNCLNLPPRLRNQPKFTCLAGVIPAPKQPDMVTISNILLPLVNELLELNRGIKIPTPKYGGGRKIVVKLVNLIGDIVANHKVAGFKSHAARKFCSWCEIEDHDRDQLILGKLRHRRGVLDASRKWKETEIVTLRDKLAKKTGVRWSELNRLPYWDPVKSVTLGVMHNWYEGVLQHHFRFRWGFDLKDVQRNTDDSEVSESESDENLEEMEIDEEYMDTKGYLTNEVKQKLKERIQEVVVPKGVTRIPKGVGDASNGKLKASKWRALFGVYLPLAVVDVFWEGEENSNLLLINTGALIECTLILGLTSLTQEDVIRFEQKYQMYQKTAFEVFPKVQVNPNHHYAMHIPEQLRNWGPLMGVSEFPGERLIGMLQKIKTNALNGCVEETIMKKFGHLQRVQKSQETLVRKDKQKNKKSNKDFKETDEQTYNYLLRYLKKKNPNLKDYRKALNAKPEEVLRNYVKEIKSLSWKMDINLSSSSPNNMIQFKRKGVIKAGRIAHILDLEREEIHMGPLILVEECTKVDRNDSTFDMLDIFIKSWQVEHLTISHRLRFISINDVVALCAYVSLPAWTLGFQNTSLLVKPVNKLLELEQS
ncbi:hypothetical protein O181_057653 [Austropuccinia psidii MF-1]|uniref:Uncharacterized protein n=1 Tax=Austropuccinia psidii MF-1 TaxID=1389203 RepID=A0A9Q3EBN2_9BASI|nr:hypothetical protein [Austropuccinia psidii MF-1]